MHWQDLVSGYFLLLFPFGFTWGVMYVTAIFSLLKICF